ncbi:WD40-repeat-containing domain protein [Pisolithus croceorrhizus]|nr:WD40-repeat-containing domain protein [Pisolithus croceorrhizus]
MSLLCSPSLKSIDRPLSAASLPDSNYVLSLTSLGNFYAASASSPSNKITLLDKIGLQTAQILPGHEEATTHLRTISSLGGSTQSTLLSSGRDGCVKAWDERSGMVSIQSMFAYLPLMAAGRRPLLCCDASSDGFLVAAGTALQNEDAFILYWDPRNPAAPLRSHGSTHSDDITAVHFGEAPNLLFSASSDGLISLSNAHELDEDEAVTYVGNWGCSISQGGWAHGDSKKPHFWTASDMETFGYWSSELDRLQDADIRHPSLHDQGQTWVTDYLINCHCTQKAESGLAVFVGSNEGDAALITNSNLSQPVAPWTIHSVWTGGHVGIVRSILWDEDHDVLVTGGEDSKILTWRIPELYSPNMQGEKDDTMQIDSPNLKREWDDIDVSEVASPGKRVRHESS